VSNQQIILYMEVETAALANDMCSVVWSPHIHVHSLSIKAALVTCTL